jgi:carboxypeptidase family protein
MKWFTRTLIAWLGLALLSPQVARAQDTSLSGIVTDSTDARLPGVTVTALHVDTGNTFAGVTDVTGQYQISGMRTGVYRVTAELQGFRPVTQDKVELLVGQRAVVNIRMTLSSLEESVTVTADAPLVDVSQSKLGGNVDARQVQELPVNGRNWMQLTMLTPGSRTNTVGDSPTLATSAGSFQLNLDGQQVTQLIAQTGYGQPRFSRDAMSEFQFITSRFDATQGRSSGAQVNAVTKSGTNNYSGTLSGYFRSDNFNAADFIVHRVLPYSDQQVSGTTGGPIVKNVAHFFAYYEGERNPQSFTFTSPYPAFNIAPLVGTSTQKLGGGRLDVQLKQSMHLMARTNGWLGNLPYDPSFCGGATLHPSRCSYLNRKSGNAFVSLTQTLGARGFNEIKVGWSHIASDQGGIVPNAPQINLSGYSVGPTSYMPLKLWQNTPHLRDDFTWIIDAWGRHDLKLGGEFLNLHTDVLWSIFRYGQIDAIVGRPSADQLNAIFPVWDNPSTWNINALSPFTLNYHKSVGNYFFKENQTDFGTWAQDNWQVTPRLTLNLGVRYDAMLGSLAEDLIVPPFRPVAEGHDLNNFVPRTGFALTLPDQKTVVRGGWGKYFAGLTDQWRQHTIINQIAAVPEATNTGRANFLLDPYNGLTPTYDSVIAPGSPYRREIAQGTVTSPNVRTPYSYQASAGVQRQIGQDMSFQADYVWTGERNRENSRQINLTYDAVTGINKPFTDISTRPFPVWGSVSMRFADGRSNYNALETAFSKRFSHHWQGSATYTLSSYKDLDPVRLLPGCQYLMSAPGVCNVPVPTRVEYGGGDYGYAVGDQRHRAVFNAIWELPYGFQASGLYFYGSGARFATTYGTDQRNSASSSPRVRPNGTIVPRNDFVGHPLHRVDLRFLRHFPLGGKARVDGIIELFNVFNHANYGSYVTSENNAAYGQPVQNVALEYQPRMMQLGFRVAF